MGKRINGMIPRFVGLNNWIYGMLLIKLRKTGWWKNTQVGMR